MLAGLVYCVHTLLIAVAARDHVLGYLGNLVSGIVWLLAAADDHLSEMLFAMGYRAGLISKAFDVRLMLNTVALAMVSSVAWRSRHRDLK